MSLLAFVSILLVPVIGYFLYWFSTPLRQTRGQPHAVSYEHSFYDTSSKSQKPFPSLFEPASLKLSLIVPAYNEEERLPVMMDETMDFLKKEYKSGYEVIIIDDGSKDKTTAVGLNYAEKFGSDVVRVLTLKKNQGKGGAVQQGMLHARGEYLLMVDADGATKIDDLSKLHKQLKEAEKDGHGIAVGSRAHLAERAAAERKWYRNILMYGFHFAVSFIGGIWNIQDTQCGFKLFTRRTAQYLFFNQRLRRWCFDVELLQLALRHGKIPMVEVGVRWQEIPGSKLNLLESSFLMARDLVVIRLAYLLHIWTADQPPSNVGELKQAAASIAARAKAA